VGKPLSICIRKAAAEYYGQCTWGVRPTENKQNISQLNRERISEERANSFGGSKPNLLYCLYPINRWSNGLHARDFEMDLATNWIPTIIHM
jgi:hypothetical protein